MKKNSTLYNVSRTILGLFLIIYALNQFFHFLPHSYGKMPGITQDFLDAVSVYLPALYFLEFILGVFLVLNKYTAFILIILAPLSVAFLIFSISNGVISRAWPAILVAGINVLLMLRRTELYKPLFKR